MRGIASIVVALCLLAVGAARADDGGTRNPHSSLIAAVGHGLAAITARRDGASHDIRLAAFTIPAASPVAAPPRSIAAACVHLSCATLTTQVPARSSRGPPGG